MPHVHVTDIAVRLFVSGRLEGRALKEFLRNLLSPCAECLRKLALYGPMLDDAEPEPPEAPNEVFAQYDAALDRALANMERHAAQWKEEKADLDRLLARVRGLPFRGSLEIFEDLSDQTHGWARIEGILALSFDLRYRDPHAMRFLARGASESVGELGRQEIDRDRYTPALKADLRAHTLIELANAERLNHRYKDAEHALAEAATCMEEGTGDLLLVGRLLDVKASLRMDERRLGEALDLLGQLHRHYLTLGENHLAGRALISKGIALVRDERPREAAGALRKGLGMIDSTRDPKLAVNGRFEFLHSLVDCGDFHKASQCLLESSLRQAFADEPLNLLKLRWVEGKIFAGLGKLRRAAEIFSEVKDEFFARDREYLAAMVGLELAGVLLRQGRAAEAEPLAEEALEIFRELGVDREALRAVRYLRDACRQRVATVEMIQEVVTFLHRLEHRPGLRFAP